MNELLDQLDATEANIRNAETLLQMEWKRRPKRLTDGELIARIEHYKKWKRSLKRSIHAEKAKGVIGEN